MSRRAWLTPLSLLLLAARPLAAAEAPQSAAAPEDPKVRATAFAMPHPGVDEATMVEIMRAIEGGMKKNPRLEMKELDTRLADFAQEVPTEQVEAARSAYRDGQRLFSELRLAEAVTALEQAAAGLALVLPYIKKQELADAMAALGVARYQNGDRKGGHAAFVELLTWRSDYLYDVAHLPPEFAAAFDEAARQVERARKLPIQIGSDPEGAQAYVDGKYIGVTPCVADGQPIGRHFVTLKREGYKKAVASVEVSRRGEAMVNLTLERSEKYLLVEQARAKVETTLGQELIDPDAENLKAVLFIDHAVFVQARAEAADKVQVDAWLYDLRNRHRLSHVHQTLARGGADPQLKGLAHNLYLNVSYEGDLPAPADAPPPPSQVKPYYKTWWFWTALGAGVVVVGGAAAAGYAIYQAQPASCDSASHCISFQP